MKKLFLGPALILALVATSVASADETEFVADELNNYKLDSEFESTSMDELISQKETAKDESVKLRAETKKEKQRLASIRRQNDQKKREIDRLVSKLRKEQGDLAKVQKDLRKVESENAQKNARVEHLRGKVSTLENQEKDSRALVAQTKKSLRDLDRENRDLSRRKLKAEKAVAKWKKEFIRYDKMKSKRLSENRKLERTIARLELQAENTKMRAQARMEMRRR